MRVFFVNDSTSVSNWGDRAAGSSMRMLIAAAGGRITHALTETALGHTLIDEIDANGSRAVATGEPVPTRGRSALKQTVPPGLVHLARRLAPEPRLIPLTWERFPKVAREAASGTAPWQAFIRAMTDTDVMVIHGDGAMEGNGIIPRTMLFLAYLAKEYYGKPVTLVNHTADFTHPHLREIAERVYPILDDVVFRDPISAERCRDMCNGRYGADSTFLFKPASRDVWTALAARPTYFDVWPDVAEFDPAQPYLCLGGSSIVTTTPDMGRIIDGYRALIDHLRTRYEGSIVLTAADPHDQPILRPLAQEFQLPLIGLSTSVQQVIDILGNADAYIGGRWHPSIFALRGGTPIVPLSAKTMKMQALARMVGLESTLPDALNLVTAVEAVGRQLVEFMARGRELRDRLGVWAAKEAEGSCENVAFLKAMATT